VVEARLILIRMKMECPTAAIVSLRIKKRLNLVGVGCNMPETDMDGDGTPDCNDACPEDKTKQQLDLCRCVIFPIKIMMEMVFLVAPILARRTRTRQHHQVNETVEFLK